MLYISLTFVCGNGKIESKGALHLQRERYERDYAGNQKKRRENGIYSDQDQ